MKKLKTKKMKFSSSERKQITDIIRKSLRTDTSTQTVIKGPIKFVNQNAFNLTVDNPKARQKLIRTLKKAAGPMQLVVRLKGPVVIGVKRMSKPKKVLNPITGKYISTEGPTCKNMLKEGFTIRDGILRPPKDYMRKNKKNATLILLTREITRIKEKLDTAPVKVKSQMKNIIDQLDDVRRNANKVSNANDEPNLRPTRNVISNTKALNLSRQPPIQLPSNTKAPNLSRQPRASPIQLPSNTKALNLSGQPRASPIQLPSNTKAPNLSRQPRASPIQLPSNTKALNLSGQPRASPIQLPSNTRAPSVSRQPVWKKALNFVNPLRMFKSEMKTENSNKSRKSREINEKMERIIDGLKK
jgi:hypothetical protein